MGDDEYEDMTTDEEEDEETEDESEDAEPVIRRNPRRGGRKKEIVKAEFSSEDEADKSFWNQAFWKDDDDKGKTAKHEYVHQGSSSSEDFSEVDETETPEPEPEKKRRPPRGKRKHGVYRDPALHKKTYNGSSKTKKRERASQLAALPS